MLPFSISRRAERGESLVRIHLHILRRAAVLILLGLIYNGLLRFNWPEMRWPGVLQRIGLCYFFAALIVLHTQWRTQAILVGVVLLSYWAVTMLVPVPGCAAGDISMQGLPVLLRRSAVDPGPALLQVRRQRGHSLDVPGRLHGPAGRLGGAVAALEPHRLAQSGGTGARRGRVPDRRLRSGGWSSRSSRFCGQVPTCCSRAAGACCCWPCSTG